MHEIVDGPKPKHAQLRDILVFTGVNDGNLEEGSFRCDANVSIRPRGESKFGTRCELKNINSFRFVQRAIESEIARQTAILDAGGRIIQETRSFDPDTGATRTLRSKLEDAQVPIVCGYLDYATKRAGLGLTLVPSGDVRADMDRIRAFYDGKRGRHPSLESVILLKEEQPGTRASTDR